MASAVLETPPKAIASAAAGTVGELRQIVSFRLGRETYGVDVLHVQEIILIGPVTQMPNVPAHVCGLINLRGHVIPVLDLRVRFSLGACEKTEHSRIIVLNVGAKTVGIVVDAVEEVLRINANQIAALGHGVAGIGQAHIRGLVKFEDRLLILLDVTDDLVADETA